MHIIFISATCYRTDYEEICQRRKYPILDSSQKFFDMFLRGLDNTAGVTVDCITVRPLSFSTYPGFFVPAFERETGNIHYYYTSIVNFPILKSLFATFAVAKNLQKLIEKYAGEDVRIICDPLLLEGLLPAVKRAAKFNIMTAGFLTDMPDFANECDRHGNVKRVLYRWYNRIINSTMKKLDRYIVLTEAMKCVADGKPWLLLDCIVDDKLLKGLEPVRYSDDIPHIMYAGKLHKEFGLVLFAEAVPFVKNECIFDIYGDGNYMDSLRELAKKQRNMRIHGIVPLEEVLRAELSATILINPRTSAGEFTQYSFPSKTAEYMLSGRPVVMFRLPGMSQQYEEYICFANEETPESFAEKIDEMLELDAETKACIGKRAKKFVLENKNSNIQAKRVVDFLGR